MASEPRKSFYVTTDLFERNISRTAKLVLTYLSRTANREGVCFPSIPQIAKHCACCENTVRKAIKELCAANVLKVETTFAATANGKQRQRANRYTLLHTAKDAASFSCAKNEPAPLQPLNPPPAKSEGEINDNSKKNTANNRPSVRKDSTDETELEDILDHLYLHLYYDKLFGKSIEHAIRTMYRSHHITVKGEKIPQGAVRNVLRMLTIDHIDFVQRQLHNGTDEVISGERYLISCIYNAPIDCLVNGLHAFG